MTGDGIKKDGPRGIIKYRIQHKFPERESEIPFATWREAQTIIGEATTSEVTRVAQINLLRSSSAGLADDIDDTAWILPVYTDGGPAANMATMVEERRRELWMQGNQAGDKLRWDDAGLLTPSADTPPDVNDGGTNWELVNEYGEPLSAGSGRCLRIPRLEVLANPNLGG